MESSSTGASLLESLHESDPFDSADEEEHPYYVLEEVSEQGLAAVVDRDISLDCFGDPVDSERHLKSQ